MKDEILDFIEDHKVLCIIIAVVAVLVIVMFGVRSSNMKKKAAEEEARQAMLAAQANQIPQDEEPEVVPTNEYTAALGWDARKNDSDRVEVNTEPESVPEPVHVQTEPTYPTKVIVFDHTSVPTRNMDGSSCKSYLNSVSLQDFGTNWGSRLTEEDFVGGDFYMVGVEQNPSDMQIGDLQSTGWLMENLANLNDNDAIKFTNLHVIGSLSTSHVAMLCSYDWYSAYGMKDTLVVFEDISGTLDTASFNDGDIFSATVFAHNVRLLKDVKGQRVLVVQYAVFE